ncbi:MAG: Mut7-C RNAse domain-containing protein [bacterium]
MKRATFRFYGELNEFLPPPRRQHPLSFPLNDRTSVKHPIESMGVPHTEVELILVNSRPVDFSYLLQAGDYVSVYPPFHTLDIRPLPPLRPPLEPPVRFLLDVHLGQLATYLRLLGFDALYRNDYDDEELADLAAESGRVLLSRDRRLLMRKQVVYGFCLRTRDPQAQLEAVLRRFDLYGQIDPWQRCLACNGRLRPVPKEEVLDRLEPKTKKYYDEFHICEECGKIYWKGSHFPRMRRFIARVSQTKTSRDGHDR